MCKDNVDGIGIAVHVSTSMHGGVSGDNDGDVDDDVMCACISTFGEA